MTLQTLVLPYNRTSPVRIPCRDLVLGGADSLGLEVSIVEYDNPGAAALVLTGGIGGPALTMLIAPDDCVRRSWDYGAPAIGPGRVLWSAYGTISATKLGTFEIHFSTATMSRWPRRCIWVIQLDWNQSGDTQMLSWGHLQVMPTVARLAAQDFLLTDTLPAVLTDDGTPILIDGMSAAVSHGGTL
jgi:hypothetical protein